MKLVSVQEIALRWGISTKMVTQLCRENRIDGVEKISGVWLIPDNAMKPLDGREQLPATASADWGFVPGELFEDRTRPTMTLKQYRFSFNSGFMKRFPETERIDILCCEEASELLIRPSQVVVASEDNIVDEGSHCDSTPEPGASFCWCYNKNGRRTTKIIQNRVAASRIYAMSACPPDKSCRFLAYRVKSDPENAFRINLSRYIGMEGLGLSVQHEKEPPYSAFTPII